MVKYLYAMQETWVGSLGWGDPLENRMATHSSILAWRIPWTEDPGESHGQRNLENPMDRGAWRATVHEVAKSQTQLSNFTFLFLTIRNAS